MRKDSASVELSWRWLQGYAPLLISALFVSVASVLLFLFSDHSVAEAAQAIPSEYQRVFFLIGSLGQAVFYLVLGPSVYVALCWAAAQARFSVHAESLRLWRRRVQYLVSSVLISGVLTDLLKVLCGRPRPHFYLEHGLDSFMFLCTSASMWSFPSGHATTIFAAMTVCYFLDPRRGYLWFSLATLVSISRVLVGAHFPSDILAGAFLGTVTSILLRDYFRHRHLLEFPGD
jgi:membrane-associated phospholipid phosphatase